MPSKLLAAAVALGLLALGLPTQARRMQPASAAARGTGKLAASASASSCTEETCMSFKADAPCSCADFIGDKTLAPRLVERVEASLTNAMQAVRKVSDKVSPSSMRLQKMFFGVKLGEAQKAIKFVVEAMVANLSPIDELMDTVVTDVDPTVYQVPAGALPIQVQVWDRQSAIQKLVRSDTLIGEAGLPLTPGEETSTLPLRPNAHHVSVRDPAGAEVVVARKVTRSPPRPCSEELRKTSGQKHCVIISAEVECIAAKSLPNTDSGLSGSTDPFCKVRIKKNPGASSVKFETPTVWNKLDTEFDMKKRKFTLEWEEVLIPPHRSRSASGDSPTPTAVDQMVPATLDEMTIGEQLVSTVYALGKDVFFAPGACEGKGSVPKKVCELFEKLGAVGVDAHAVKEAAEEVKDRLAISAADDVEQLARRVSSQKVISLIEAEAEAEETVQMPVGHVGAVVAANRYHQQRYGGGVGGYAGYRHSGESDPRETLCAAVCLAVIIILIIIMG